MCKVDVVIILGRCDGMRAKAMGRLSVGLWNMKERPYSTMMGQLAEFGVTEKRQIRRLEKARTCLEVVFEVPVGMGQTLALQILSPAQAFLLSFLSVSHSSPNI